MMVEADEFYINVSLKGRPSNKYIMNIGRLPRHIGHKPWKGRGTFDKDHSRIICIHQGDNRIAHFDISVKQPLIDMVCSNVCYGSTLYTDEFVAYNELNRYGFMHEHVNRYQKEYARRGDIQVNNCECRSNIYQLTY